MGSGGEQFGRGGEAVHSMTALVVDDSRVARIAVMQGLRESKLASFTFVEAPDGIEALEILANEAIDIIFLDWNLPHLDGPEVVKELRRSRRTASIPVVMVTSERSLGKLMQAVDDSEVDGYVCKPFTVDELVQRLTPLFEQIRSGRPRGAKKGAGAEKKGGFLRRLLGRE